MTDLRLIDNKDKREGGYVIVGRPPDYPYWEWVFTNNEDQTFQEIKDPNRVNQPFIFMYKEDAQECLDKILDIKYQRGLMFGCELKVIGLDDISKPTLTTKRVIDQGEL